MKLKCTNCGRTAETKSIGADPFCEPDGQGDYNAWDGTDGQELCPECRVKATPGPWRITDASGRREIAQTVTGRLICEVYNAPGTDNREANAALIVRAVNSHDALVDACHALMAGLEMVAESTGTTKGLKSSPGYRQAVEALAKAEERT
jgi:hypothetical protein